MLCVCKLVVSLPFLSSLTTSNSLISFCCCLLLVFTDFLVTGEDMAGCAETIYHPIFTLVFIVSYVIVHSHTRLTSILFLPQFSWVSSASLSRGCLN